LYLTQPVPITDKRSIVHGEKFAIQSNPIQSNPIQFLVLATIPTLKNITVYVIAIADTIYQDIGTPFSLRWL